jgi:hypothetical protein
VLVTFQVHYLATAHDFAPYYLKVPVPHNHQLAFRRSAQQVKAVLILQVVAGCQLHLFLLLVVLFLTLYEDIVIFELLVFGKCPEVDLVTADSGEF